MEQTWVKSPSCGSSWLYEYETGALRGAIESKRPLDPVFGSELVDQMGMAVVIPVYNAATMVADAVLCCRKQDQVREVVVVDDHSQDDSWQRVGQIERSEVTRLQAVKSHVAGNRGAGVARNTGVQQVNQSIVSFMDVDDHFLTPRYDPAEIRMAALGYAVCRPFIISEFGSDKEEVRFMKNRWSSQSIQFYWAMVAGADVPIHMNAVTLKKSLFQSMGGFPALRIGEDTALWWRLALVRRWQYLGGNPVARHVRRPGSVTYERSTALRRSLVDAAVVNYTWVLRRGCGRITRRLANRTYWFHIIDATEGSRWVRICRIIGNWVGHMVAGRVVPGPIGLLDWMAFRKQARSC